MNHVGVLGRLTRDPELRYTPQGRAVVDFTLAVHRHGADNETDFFECTAWEKQAENIANSCQKGHRLLVWGRLRQEKWTDQNQQPRTTVKIIVTGFSFIEPPPQQQQQYQAPATAPPQYQGYGPQGYGQQPGYGGPPMPPTGGYPPAGSGQPPGYQGPQSAAGNRQGPAAQRPPNQAQVQGGINWNDIPF
jgi:single-strand DNA-binding protein